jgi:anthranilate phosphoribosyltransferase
VRGGDPELNAQIIEGVLAGESSPEADIVALNAAAAILVAGLEDDIAAALLRAREALGSGGAAAKLQALREFV